MTEIHPLAFVDPKAELGPEVRIGPFCYVGPGVNVGPRCVLHPHVTLLGPSQFGADNEFFSQCTLGAAPQDVKYMGGPTRLVVGSRNVFREGVTVHRGTETCRLSEGTTRIGDRNLFMVGVHVAHDADIGSNVILANAVQLAGHVRIEDFVTVGGVSAMHHFVTVGRNAYITGMTRVTHDVPPYVKVEGYDQAVRAVNVTGMRRWQISEESIRAVKEAFRVLFGRRLGEEGARTMVDGLAQIESNGLMSDDHVRYLVQCMRRKLDCGVFGRARERDRAEPTSRVAAYYTAGVTEPRA